METNLTPIYDQSDNPTGCCPRFDPAGWDNQELHFKNKRFVRATTHSLGHIPLNMGRVFGRVQGHIDEAGAMDAKRHIVLSHELSAFAAEHLFAATCDVPKEEMTTLSGDFLTYVFDGPYAETRQWHDTLQDLARAKGYAPGTVWYFFTTCPKCAKTYGHNPVVGVVELLPSA